MITRCNLKFHTVSIIKRSLAQAIHAREKALHAKMVVPNNVDAASRMLNATAHADAVAAATGEWSLKQVVHRFL
jgi:hypothetical protein